VSEPRGGLPALGIRRPVLVLVLNLLVALAGVAALLAVEIRELPDVDRPRVTVTATYPGASPETMDAEVTRLIEGAIARVSGVRSISAASEENNTRIVIEFSPASDLDQVAADTREAVSRIRRELPDDVEQVNVVKADDNASPVVRIAARSESMGSDALTRVVEQDIIPELVSVPGVADVSLFGERQRQLRVVVDPLRLASYGLAVNDLVSVLEGASLDVPAGSFRSDDLELLVRADASTVTADQVEALELRESIRVGDVAHATFAPADASSFVRLDGRAIVGLGIIRQARSNTVEISSGIDRVLERLNARFDDIDLVKTSDDAIFIRGSIREVLITLGFSTLIVIASIWLFIGSPRATLIPAVSIPLALIGTVAAIWLFGFSINLLTLLALVLATGLVVDDSIVVLENIQRRRDQGLGPRAAALLGTHQVFFAVVATTAVLISVFVPISLLPSTAGRLFREFGIVLAVAVTLSSFVALSLVPTMAARVLAGERRRGRLAAAFARFGNRIAGGYASSLGVALRRPLLATGLGLLAAGGATVAFQGLDRELLPAEDRGLLFISATGPDGAGLTYTERQADRMEAVVRPLIERGEVARMFTIVGRYDPNRALIVAPLVPWDERERSQQAIAADLRAGLADIPGAQIRVGSPNSLSLRGVGAGLEVALIGNDYPTIYAAAREFARRVATELPELSQPEISYQPSQPQLRLNVDRQRAAELGIPLDGLAATLRTMIDGEELVDLNVADEAVPLFLESATGEINDPGDLANLYVSTDGGELVPLSSVVTVDEEGVAAELDREFQRRAMTLDVAVAAGYPLQSALDDLRTLADEVLPVGVSMVPLGEAQTLQETTRDVTLTYGLALLVVLLVLCAQFESLTSALVVTLTVPFGVAAAVFALYLTGTSVNIYSQIGLILLIGLMAKNGILLVEFADQLRDRGASVTEAALQSARVRLRPVAMTMIATVLGGLPLIIGSGPGAEARAAIGWVVFGGLGLAAVFTLYLTPVIYQALARFSRPRASETARLERELEDAAISADRV